MPWTLLLNPKLWGALLIAIVLGGAYYEYHSLQSDLTDATAALKQEKDNNAVLRDNIDVMSQANAQNALILQQQVASAKTTVETVTKLSNELKRSSQSFNDTKTRIDTIKDVPVPLTSYIKEAINGIQSERDIVNPPAPPASAPVTPQDPPK